MGEYSLVYADRDSTEAFSPYNYRVLEGDRVVAEISHTYRGDEHFIRKPLGEWEATDRLIDGGGPEPLRLTALGVKAVEKLLAR